MDSTKKTLVTFDLRPAKADDTEFLYQLYSTTRIDELDAAGFLEEQREPFLRMQFEAQKFHYEKFYPNAEQRIVTAGSRAVGRDYVNRDQTAILLVDLALLPEFCNLGIGTKLLEKLCQESACAGLPLRLYAVKFNNRALSLYERLGFKTIDDTGIYLLLERRAAEPNKF